MRKKVVVYYEDGGKLEYKGYANKDDNYFIAIHKIDSDTVKITRQYYPLKDNEMEVIFDRDNISNIDINGVRKAMEDILEEIKLNVNMRDRVEQEELMKDLES